VRIPVPLIDIYRKLRLIKDFLSGPAPEGIDALLDALEKVTAAGREIEAYLRSLADAPVFSVADADARLKLESLLNEIETEPTAQGPILSALIRAAVAELIRRLLAANAPTA
jgi:hypothetical protein